MPGDAVIVNGTLADHGVAILLARNELALDAAVASDCQPLHGLVATMLTACPDLPALFEGCYARWHGHRVERVRVFFECMHPDPRIGSPPRRGRYAGLARFSDSTRYTWRTKASSWRLFRRDLRMSCWRPARTPCRSRCGDHRRGDSRTGGQRDSVDRLWWRPHCRHARRRATAADLLMAS